jgi:hypothetical protein
MTDDLTECRGCGLTRTARVRAVPGWHEVDCEGGPPPAHLSEHMIS